MRAPSPARDSSDFFLDHYNEQLVAGYEQNLPDGGLIVHTPDWPRIASIALKPRSNLRCDASGPPKIQARPGKRDSARSIVSSS